MIYSLVLVIFAGGLSLYLYRAPAKQPKEVLTVSSTPANEKLTIPLNSTELLPNTPATALPLPIEFSIYEEYANTESALFIDEMVGQGAPAVIGKRVAMLYKGWLTNGELFDQSRADETGQIQPFVFELGAGQVIAGWEQTIEGMKVGGKRRLIVPSAFGYGPTGQDPIPPNSTLIFDIELLEVEM